jgi:hypothetical protein
MLCGAKDPNPWSSKPDRLVLAFVVLQRHHQPRVPGQIRPQRYSIAALTSVLGVRRETVGTIRVPFCPAPSTLQSDEATSQSARAGLLNGAIIYALREAQIIIESWRLGLKPTPRFEQIANEYSERVQDGKHHIG